jgi:hypothetical protein
MNTRSRIRTYSAKRKNIIGDFYSKDFYQAPNGNVNRVRLFFDEFGDVLVSISFVFIISSSLSIVMINSLSGILLNDNKNMLIKKYKYINTI